MYLVSMRRGGNVKNENKSDTAQHLMTLDLKNV